ncbi:3-keto-5-aminohexanoate cleavage enzyme [Phyllobacterium sp. CL33Tsu]|nr:3-keto-5-aminohexanoate cleavage enzyme [Phyllobacterium sp. CL33Tsu]
MSWLIASSISLTCCTVSMLSGPFEPCIICVAITGSLPQKSNNPAVPITIAEQVESTHGSFEAGATIVHCHVRPTRPCKCVMADRATPDRKKIKCDLMIRNPETPPLHCGRV